jgi:hypothetical protein
MAAGTIDNNSCLQNFRVLWRYSTMRSATRELFSGDHRTTRWGPEVANNGWKGAMCYFFARIVGRNGRPLHKRVLDLVNMVISKIIFGGIVGVMMLIFSCIEIIVVFPFTCIVAVECAIHQTELV